MEYRGFIFTRHALDRLVKRRISQDSVVATLQRPDSTKPTEKENTTKFTRTLNGRLMHVVATYLIDQRKWLIISVWVRGEDDQPPWQWLLLTAPFKVSWWLLKKAFSIFR